MESEHKKRKINPPPRRVISSSTTAKEAYPKANDGSAAAGAPVSIQQARSYAVAQAQEEGCTANFRIFDSPFGNFLIPVIPTRAELSG
ncbi:hypothetical protein BVRB_8g197570 [Beta vulgaris subsp. vulgaris]|nr:hypothetical protein BVRB_8g197570 [Beta vulgaris subsp. vulgaris]